VGDPFAISVLVRVETLALAIGEADEALLCAFLSDKTCRELSKSSICTASIERALFGRALIS
jgi:hypothetical protein